MRIAPAPQTIAGREAKQHRLARAADLPYGARPLLVPRGGEEWYHAIADPP